MKKIFLSIACLFTLFFSVGCGCQPKTAISTETFIEICESKSYEVVDVKEQYSAFTQIEEATVARSGSDWQIEFYVLDTTENALIMFATNQSIFESYKSGSTSETSMNMQNYSIYSHLSIP